MAAPPGNRTPPGQSGPGNLPPGAERPPIPWHFKLFAALFAVYLALRIVQMLGWIGVSVKDLHNALAIAIVLVNGVAAIWGLFAWWRGWPLVRGYLFLALLGWFLFIPQLALGIALYASGHRAPAGWHGWQHYIYGIGAVLGISIGAYYRRRLPERPAMVLGLICFFLALVAARAYVTGHG